MEMSANHYYSLPQEYKFEIMCYVASVFFHNLSIADIEAYEMESIETVPVHGIPDENAENENSKPY